MNFKIGDYVSRKSYDYDTIFQIITISGNNVLLKGVNIRLYADSDISDLRLEKNIDIIEDDKMVDRLAKSINLDRSEFFYLPGKVLHIDTDILLSNNPTKPYKIRKKAKIRN